MKKLIIAAIFAFSAVGFANAQFYIGGGLSLGSMSGSSSVAGVTTDDPSTFAYNIGPRLGYQFAEKWSAGLDLSIGQEIDKTPGVTEITETTTNWGVSPFVRYAVWGNRNFALNLEGNVIIRGGSTKIKPNDLYSKNNSMTFGINIAPVVSFKVSNHISFETRFDFLRLGYSTTTHTATLAVGGVENKTTENAFGLLADANNILTLGDITFGMTYKF